LIQKTTIVQTQKKIKVKEQNLRHYGITQKLEVGPSVLEGLASPVPLITPVMKSYFPNAN
jgi:hypothetical protein